MTGSAVVTGLLVLSAGLAHGGGEYEEAKLNAGKQARDLAVSQEVEALLRQKEREVAERRKAGVTLIETYLREHPRTPETAELLFQLAELRWEEAKAEFLERMAGYNAAVERCQQAKEAADRVKEENKPEGPRLEGKAADKNEAPHRAARKKDRADRFEPVRCRTPEQPQLDLASSEVIYKRILDEHPHFPKTDAVLYLYGFSLRSQGHSDESLAAYRRILAEFPRSRFRPDAWMAVAEARFYTDSDYKGALQGYEEVLRFPDSPLFDLALFKTAWCFWKLGEPDKAARRFKEVLDLGSGQGKGPNGTTARADQLTEGGRKRLAELKSEALDYLVQIFTEDERKGAKDAYDFLSSIGGAAYSRKVVGKLSSTFFNQARYERAIEAERFLIALDPLDPECPDRQKQIALSYREMDDNKAAVRELRKLAEAYLEGSEWAKAQSKDAVKAARDKIATLLRDQAKNLHADAQRVEMYQKKIDLERYGRAAEAYTFYLSRFADDTSAIEISYLLGDIHFLKTRENEKAGDAYLLVGKSKPVGKLHKDALLNAITAYERVRQERRPGGQGIGKQALLPTDKKMGEAIDLYASLFPTDPEIPGILYKNGELFYVAGDFDEAIKRFGLIVEKYPKNAAAQDAGNKILESLNKAKDYENVEGWARRLLKVQAFQDKGSQERLGKLVIDAGMKAGEQKAEQDPLAAAQIYVRVQNEFPSSPRASQALTNAAMLYTRAGRPDESVKVYAKLLDKYPTAPEAAAAAWNAGKLYEASVQWVEAARFYTILADKYPKDGKAADALYNAGILKEHLGDTQGAITAFGEYARRHKEREDARKVAFRIGVVLGESGQHEAAARAFADFVRQYPSGSDAIEALERQGEALVKIGQERRAEDPLKRCIAMYKKSGLRGGPAGNAAAHARYLEGETVFRDFERLQLAKEPRRLKKTLDEKSALLEKAKGVFIDVVTFNDPEWATAALYRIGEGYERFAKALRDAPVPPGLDEQSQQVYREELEKVVVVVEEKAIDAYRGGYKKALDLTVYNDFTQKLRQALGRLSDQEFPAENEARSRPTMADRAQTIPFVGSVDR